MSERDRYAVAASALHAATARNADLCRPFVSALAVTGAAVTTLGDPLGTETVCASDALAARIDEIQADLGEGPCWEAAGSGLPALEPDLQHGTDTSWPVARSALRETGIGAIHAFPLTVGRLTLGSVDLYTLRPGAFTGTQVADASALAAIAARQVLRRAFSEIARGSMETEPGEYSRREVHQATGMVSAQLRIPVEDALLLLRGHAFGNGRTLRETATEVVQRRLDFSEAPREGEI